MPKENTHLFFAKRAADESQDSAAGKIIGVHPDYYYLGSVAPDIFFYGKTPAERKISPALHGKDGQPSNDIVFQLLDWAKKRTGEKELAFTLGYLTHCALDIIFHPAVIYLTGNIFSGDRRVRSRADYAHRRWETGLDAKINRSRRYGEMIKPELVMEIEYSALIAERFGVSRERVGAIIRRQRLANALMRSRTAYCLIKMLSRLGLYSRREDLGLSYCGAENGRFAVPEKLSFRDPVTGEKKESSIEALMAEAAAKARVMFFGAMDYYREKIGKEELIKRIPGESLETGKTDCPVSRLKFFKDDSVSAGRAD